MLTPAMMDAKLAEHFAFEARDDQRIDKRSGVSQRLPITVMDRQQAAQWMIEQADAHPRGQCPLYLTSANGEVIARTRADVPAAAAPRAGHRRSRPR